MRRVILSALTALAACATTPSSLPSLHYADAASHGSVASFFAGRPNAAQVSAATETWSRALGDSFACEVPMRHIVDAGLAGALEIGAMNAAASRGGEREIRQGISQYLGDIVALAVDNRPEPSRARCDALMSWAPRTAEEGREAVARARRNGLMENEYGVLLDLMAR